MIQLISSNNVELVLDPKTKIRVEWNSPIFSEDTIQGDKVYWFDIPFHPINLKEFGHANIPAVSGKAKILDFKLILLGSISMTGKLIVSTSKEKFRVAFTTNTLQAYKEMLLNEVDLGADISMGSTTQNVIDHANGKNSVTYPGSNYAFPVIKNEDLYGSENPAYLGYMNNFDFVNNTFKKNYLDIPEIDADAPDGIINKFPLVPQFFLQFILDKLFAEMQLNHFGEFFTEADYRQLLLFNAFCLDDNVDEYWIKSTGGYRDPYVPTAIRFDAGGISHGSQMSPNALSNGFRVQQAGWHQIKIKVWMTKADPLTDLYVRQYCDMVYTNDVEIPKEEALNSEIIENIHTVYFTAADIGKDVWCGCASDWTIEDAELNVVNLSETNLNRYSKSITLSDHIPAISINEFLNSLRKFWQMAIIIDPTNAQAQFLLLKDLFTTQSVDFTDKFKKEKPLESIDSKTINIDFSWDKDNNFLDTSIYNDKGNFDQYKNLPASRNISDIAKMNPANAIYKVVYIDFQNIWKKLSDLDQLTTYGNGEDLEEIPLEMHPAFMTGFVHKEEKGKSQFLFAIPEVSKQGKSKMFNSENDEDPILKLMRWKGLSSFEKLDENDGTYPFATSHNIDSKGTSTMDTSLFMKGANGIGEKLHKKWFEFKKNTETFNLNGGANFQTASLLKLLELIKPQNVPIAEQKRWVMIESIKYLPKQITAEISIQALESVEVKSVKQAF
jgi:hypothetical protein